MKNRRKRALFAIAMTLACLLGSSLCRADVVTDWNVSASEIVTAAKISPLLATRHMAIVQAAVYEAVNAITRRYPADGIRVEPAPDAAIEAAVAAANRSTLRKLVPAQQSAIDRAYDAALTGIPEGPGKSQGIAVGERAASAVLAVRADDGFDAREDYRPYTTPGVYVPTALPVVPQWPKRKPWVMTKPDQFRPGPPPALSSEAWAHDYNEVKAMGGKTSATRTREQDAIARYWEGAGPVMYLPIARSVANQPGREVTRNARLLALATQAMDDGAIAVFDAKYHYNFWRPITAIRNGDTDENRLTERDPSWLPFLETPLHPEYPAAHCVTAAALAAVLRADIGDGPTPMLKATSPTAPGVERSWSRLEDFVQEVENARVYGGIHFRSSTRTGASLGRQVGNLVAEKGLRERP